MTTDKITRAGKPGSQRMTAAMLRDLQRTTARYQRTVGTYDYPNGDAIALRTGPALERLGLVRWANQFSANRRRRWLPTPAGLVCAAQHPEQAEAKRPGGNNRGHHGKPEP